MNLILLVGLFLAGTAVALVGRALAMPRMRAAQTMGRIEAYGYLGGHAPELMKHGVARSALDDIAGALGALVADRFGKAHEDDLRTDLIAAGLYRTTPRKFIGYQALAAVGVPATWLWLASQGALPGALAVLGVPVVAFMGWYAPVLLLRKRAERRFTQIEKTLPELIDLLIVTVEAGLGFSASLGLAAKRLHGPLGDELRLVLQEQSMGLSTNEALRNMQLRCTTPSVRTFVRSILQGETLGVSIGQIMRNLAGEMRDRRRQLAQAKAMKAPIKMLFPLIFLIFPAMLVILLAPAIFNFIDATRG
jgi:tight adherence protein C